MSRSANAEACFHLPWTSHRNPAAFPSRPSRTRSGIRGNWKKNMYQDGRPCRLVTTAFWKPAGCGTDARTFDGYKSHFSVDPDEELITNVAVTAANSADRYVIDKLLDPPATGTPAAGRRPAADELAAHTGANSGSDSQAVREPKDFEAYSDSAYAEGATPDKQTARGHDMRTKVPPVRNANGLSKDEFSIDLAAGTVTCPARHTVAIGSGRRHPVARFGRFWGWG